MRTTDDKPKGPDVSMYDYCKNPQEYKYLPATQINKYNKYCQASKELNNDSVLKGSIFLPMNELAKLGKDVPDAAEKAGKLLWKMIQSVFTPQGMVMLMEFEGVKFALKKFFFYLAKFSTAWMKNAATFFVDDMAGMASELSLDGFTEVLCTIATFPVRFILDSVGILLSLGPKLVTYFSEMMEDVEFDIIGVAMLIFQTIGMLMDLWNPCDIKQQVINAEVLTAFNTGFNQVFRTQLMPLQSSGSDSLYFVWPVDYTADKFMFKGMYDDMTNPVTGKTYTYLMHYYTSQYMYSLRYNFLGYPFVWPNNGTGYLLNKSGLQQIEKQASLFFGDGNTVVANWFYRFWPLILLGVIILIIFIFVIIKFR